VLLMQSSFDPAIRVNGLPAMTAEDGVQEKNWVIASQKGDTLAFNRLVLKWEKSIFNLTLRMLQDPAEAEETCQDVFLAAFKSIRKFRLDARFSTWLYRIAVNHCITRLRRRPPGVHYSLEDDSGKAPLSDRLPAADSQEGDFLRDECDRKVRSALAFLPADQRAVVELKFFQELTFEEISAVIEAPLSTVKSRLYAGLDMLKVRLGGLRLQV
jgi:RNA polymerase sigma-70 factor, ECF subfamily